MKIIKGPWKVEISFGVNEGGKVDYIKPKIKESQRMGGTSTNFAISVVDT